MKKLRNKKQEEKTCVNALKNISEPFIHITLKLQSSFKLCDLLLQKRMSNTGRSTPPCNAFFHPVGDEGAAEVRRSAHVRREGHHWSKMKVGKRMAGNTRGERRNLLYRSTKILLGTYHMMNNTILFLIQRRFIHTYT